MIAFPVHAGSLRSKDVLKASETYIYIHRNDRLPYLEFVDRQTYLKIDSGPVGQGSSPGLDLSSERLTFSDFVEKRK